MVCTSVSDGVHVDTSTLNGKGRDRLEVEYW